METQDKFFITSEPASSMYEEKISWEKPLSEPVKLDSRKLPPISDLKMNQENHRENRKPIVFAKLSEIDLGVVNMKTELPNLGWCPKCTLKVPCKHYSKAEDIPQTENPYKP